MNRLIFGSILGPVLLTIPLCAFSADQLPVPDPGQSMEAHFPATSPPTGESQLRAGAWLTAFGSAFTVLGVVQLFTAVGDPLGNATTSICFGAGAVQLGIGIPLLVVGKKRQRAYQRWKATAHLSTAIERHASHAIHLLNFSTTF